MPGTRVSDLARIVERLIAALRPERIDVFGSQARGDARVDSDVDLLVIVPQAETGVQTRVGGVCRSRPAFHVSRHSRHGARRVRVAKPRPRITSRNRAARGPCRLCGLKRWRHHGWPRTSWTSYSSTCPWAVRRERARTENAAPRPASLFVSRRDHLGELDALFGVAEARVEATRASARRAGIERHHAQALRPRPVLRDHDQRAPRRTPVPRR